MDADSPIRRNIRAHDRIARSYRRRHPELFCPAEQERLRDSLRRAAEMIQSGSPVMRGLDYGCGTGNVTRHLVEMGMEVVAADVSGRFLDCVRTAFADTGRVRTLPVNGQDLAGVADGSFDLAASYSVLHHVPDYLKMVDELARVTAAGGVVYIDHEGTEVHWRKSEEYAKLKAVAQANCPRDPWWRKLLQPNRCVWRFKRMWDARFQPEGDIHVWPDDHIEWDRIEGVLSRRGLEILWRHDYLFPLPWYPPEVYEHYRHRCHDTRLLVARRPAEADSAG